MGEGVALASAVTWALTTAAMRPIGARALLLASAVRMVSAALVALLYGWPTGALERALAAPPSLWALLFGSVLLALVVGDSLFFIACSRVGIARALPIASSFPLLTTAGAVVFLDEPLTLALGVGCVLVVLGVASIAGDRAPAVPGAGGTDRLGLALAALTACTWATNGLLMRPALDLLDPTATTAVRFSLSALVFAAIAAVRLCRSPARLTRRQVALAAGAGLTNVSSSLLFLTGITLIGVARTVALNATAPIFSAVLGVTLLRERASRRVWLGIALTVGGSALLVSG